MQRPSCQWRWSSKSHKMVKTFLDTCLLASLLNWRRKEPDQAKPTRSIVCALGWIYISLHHDTMEWNTGSKRFQRRRKRRCPEVRFASLLSSRFTTMKVMNPLDWKLANHTFVHWCILKKYELPWLRTHIINVHITNAVHVLLGYPNEP